MAENTYPQCEKVDLVSGARILFKGWDPEVQHDIHIKDGKIEKISPHVAGTSSSTSKNVLDANSSLIAPSLCHSHIHLDKCFLLSDPKFADLEIVKGDFAEAMEITAKAKARFDREDLLRRGRWLVAESIAAGVTHMRAFVEGLSCRPRIAVWVVRHVVGARFSENSSRAQPRFQKEDADSDPIKVDHIVRMKCLDAAISLKKQFEAACEIQICAFAQEPIYSGPHGAANREFIEIAVLNEHVSVIGTTPYVEKNEDDMKKNIDWAFRTASGCRLHLDFHLDYNLDGDGNTWTPLVAKQLESMSIAEKHRLSFENLTVVLGHCTRLTLHNEPDWQALSQSVQNLKLFFVGLPTSDLYMMGRPFDQEGGGERVRGTLQIPHMIQKYGIKGSIAINNVGNAFTPYGSCDPLKIASMGVGLYHAGTKADAQLLYECVSGRAIESIGYASRPFAIGEPATFILFEMIGPNNGLLSSQRGRKTLQEVLYDPPERRKTIFEGCLITT